MSAPVPDHRSASGESAGLAGGRVPEGTLRDPFAAVEESVREALCGLHYGTVTLVVHDGAVVQIDRTEKLRLPGGRAAKR